MPLETDPLRRRIQAGPERVRSAIEVATDAWHGDWDRASGNIEIAVRAGVRRGRWRGQLEMAGDQATTHLVLTPVEAWYRLDQGSVVLLSISAMAAIPLILWPFIPRLLSFMPIALVLAVGGWFLVVSRLQNQGPEGFLETIDHLATLSDESDTEAEDRSA